MLSVVLGQPSIATPRSWSFCQVTSSRGIDVILFEIPTSDFPTDRLFMPFIGALPRGLLEKP